MNGPSFGVGFYEAWVCMSVIVNSLAIFASKQVLMIRAWPGSYTFKFPMAVFATAYKYENDEVGSAVLYECRGLLSFQSRSHVTDWHGSWKEGEQGHRVQLLFDCNGDEERLKSVILYPRSEGVYEGFDYQGRVVRLTLLRRFTYNHATRIWQ